MADDSKDGDDAQQRAIEAMREALKPADQRRPQLGADLSVVDVPTPADDADPEKAARETQGFADGNLEKDAAQREHGRRENLRDVAHRLSVIALYVLAGLVLIGVLVIVFHWMSPEAWHFLSSAQLDRLQTIGGSALFTGFIGAFGKKVLAKL